MAKVIGEVEFATKASGGVTTGSVFLDSADNVLKAKDSAGTSQMFSDLLVGMIVGWDKDLSAGVPSLPADFVGCNGQTLSDAGSPLNGMVMPDLNGGTTQRFLRGNTTSGGTGGSDTHSHSISTTYTDSYPSVGGSSATGTGNGNTLPSYYEVVWIIKVK